MSFRTVKDYFGIADGTTIVVTSSDENKSATLVQAKDEKGDVVAQEMLDEQMAPSCNYVFKADATINAIKIGYAVSGDNSKFFTTNQLTINTGAGTAPTMSASGQEVPSQDHTDCYYEGPSGTVKMCHHAQLLFGLNSNVTMPTGCYLTTANYTIGGSLTTATKDGKVVSYDISDGKVTASLTFVSVDGTAKPTITAGTLPTDWTITTPLTLSEPDADYPTYTCEISKCLVHHKTTT